MSRSPFWTFSLAVYGTPGVPDACIKLQDVSGVDVNVMLYLLWLAGQGRQLSEGDVRDVVGAVDGWKRDVVVPIRTARRALKEPPSAFDPGVTEALRTKVKAIELEAERLQQEALFGFKPVGEIGIDAASSKAAAEDNLAHYASVLGESFDQVSLETVIAAALAKAKPA